MVIICARVADDESTNIVDWLFLLPQDYSRISQEEVDVILFLGLLGLLDLAVLHITSVIIRRRVYLACCTYWIRDIFYPGGFDWTL